MLLRLNEADGIKAKIACNVMFSQHWYFFSFLEDAGELCIIILRRKRGFKKSKQHHSPTLTHTHMLTSTAITLTNTWKKTPLTTRPSQKWLLERGGEKLLEPQPSSINVGPLSWNVELHSG